MNQFIAPTHPGQTITPVAVTTPEEVVAHRRGFSPCRARWHRGSPEIFGPGGPAWPDVPWWNLTGLFDLTLDQSIQDGVTDLERRWPSTATTIG